MKKEFLVGVISALMAVCMVSTATATNGKVQKEIEYRDIKVSLDGQVLDLRDAKGNAVEPFMFAGTNYIPARALAEALGLEVAWDGSTSTVVLTTPSKSINAGAKLETSATTPQPELKKAFSEQLKQYNYVGSSESDKYHNPTCRWTSEINENNLVYWDTIDQAKADGYSACGTCSPR